MVGVFAYTFAVGICIYFNTINVIRRYFARRNKVKEIQLKFVSYCLILLALTVTISVPSWAEEKDLILYFDYEDFKGGEVVEKSISKRNGKIEGKVVQVDNGKFGKAGKFAAGSFLDLDGATFPKDNIPTKAWSLLAWINVEAISDMAIFNARSSEPVWLIHPEARGGGNYRWLLRGNGNTKLFDIRAGKNKANAWQHYAGIFNGKKGILYINGNEVGAQDAGAKSSSTDWGLGARVGFNIDNNRPFTGLMDDLNIWKKALTQDEIKAVMNDGVDTFLSVEAHGKLTTQWSKIKAHQ